VKRVMMIEIIAAWACEWIRNEKDRMIVKKR
jgi:hypothetical protein